MSEVISSSKNVSAAKKMENEDPLENDQDCTDGEDNSTSVRRPMNAFFIFCKRHRDIVREKYPHLENRCITKILAEWWANLDPSEKASYTALAKQYKEAFMKAYPDFKWYKLPTPPARTLVTRPSNSRSSSNQNEKSSQELTNCGITLGKLVDDEQLGGLSSLINSSPSIISNNNTLSPSMAQKTAKSILKPPKKRYLVNGEFKCHSEMSAIENMDFPTRSACSALLEFAEICSSNAVRETVSTALNDKGQDSKTYTPPVTANNKYPEVNFESPDHSLSGCFTYPALCDMQKSQRKPNLFSSEGTNSSSLHRIDNISDQQEQPLDLCKNKGKTIKASNQQIIDHLVDKYLCDTSVPQNNYLKPSVIDTTFCKILSDGCASGSSTSKGEKVNHPSFTLSVAIESTINKSQSKNSINHQEEVPDYSAIVKHITRKSCDFNLQFKTEDIRSSLKSTSSDTDEASKSSEQNVESTSSFCFDSKSIKQVADSTSSDIVNDNSVNTLNHTANIEYKKNENSSSQFFCKMISPPKKSRVWCNIFMKEQLSKNEGIESNSHVSNSVVSDLPSPARRSSQRTCKGRRYQALITEGLLQSSKERKPNNNRKSVPSVDKGKNKINLVIENNLNSSSKKKRKKEKDKNKSTKAESQEFEKSLFNLEEKIASLPKCSFDHLNKKKKIMLETNGENVKEENVNPSTSTSSKNFNTSSSEISEWHTVSSSGRFKTGNFDLEHYISSLPKCDIEVLNKRKKKD